MKSDQPSWPFRMTVFLGALLASAWVCQPQQPAQAQDDGTMTIDGAVNPELIPDYVVWELLFESTANAARENYGIGVFRVITGIAGLTDKERSIIVQEARLQDVREQRCNEALDAKRSELRATGVRDIDTASRLIIPVMIDCRQKTLDAATRLLERLRPEAQAELLAQLERRRRQTKTTLPKSLLKQYLQPH